MLIDLHGLVMACESSDALIHERWAESFASRPRVVNRTPDLTFTLQLTSRVPDPPQAEPIYMQGDLLATYQPTNQRTIIHFPRFGQLHIDLHAHRTEGELVTAALKTYGVLEDVIAMGLTAHLRRRSLFLIHAFAAAAPTPSLPPETGEGAGALLLVGDIGSGKTTTGISLLRAGWKLLSNDSPLLTDGGLQTADGRVIALAYPGLLSAYTDTLQRFPELTALTLTSNPSRLTGAGHSRRKITFAAESIAPNVWIESAPVSAIVFPRVAHIAEHHVTRLSEPDALRLLLPNAIDRWDAEMIPAHLQLVTSLVAQAPAYALELGERVDALPSLLQSVI